MISPVPLSRIDFFVHLGASRKKQPQNEDRGQCRERGRPKGESKLTDNTVFRWREGCIPRRPEEPAMQAEARERIGWETWERLNQQQHKFLERKQQRKTGSIWVNLSPAEGADVGGV